MRGRVWKSNMRWSVVFNVVGYVEFVATVAGVTHLVAVVVGGWLVRFRVVIGFWMIWFMMVGFHLVRSRIEEGFWMVGLHMVGLWMEGLWVVGIMVRWGTIMDDMFHCGWMDLSMNQAI